MMDIITPDWPAPDAVRAVITTRRGGVSQPPWHELNLAYHVGDQPGAVDENWKRLTKQLQLPSPPQLLQQVHGTKIVSIDSNQRTLVADGCYAEQPGRVCTIMTADCLPVLLCNKQGTEVSAIHAGWRGLAAGIVDRAVARFNTAPAELMAYLGPAISQSHFEVGRDVLDTFLANVPEREMQLRVKSCFSQTDGQHWHADLYRLARIFLKRRGVAQVYGGDYCTYDDTDNFYSYRREGQTGRMASLIWISG